MSTENKAPEFKSKNLIGSPHHYADWLRWNHIHNSEQSENENILEKEARYNAQFKNVWRKHAENETGFSSTFKVGTAEHLKEWSEWNSQYNRHQFESKYKPRSTEHFVDWYFWEMKNNKKQWDSESPSEIRARYEKEFSHPQPPPAMSNTQHTPEPWAITPGDGTIIKHYHEKGPNIGSTYQWFGQDLNSARANAQRIVACVNACAGITNEELAYMSRYFGKEGRTYYTLVQDMRQAEAERDEIKAKYEALKVERNDLLTAVRSILNQAGTEHEWPWDFQEVFKNAEKIATAVELINTNNLHQQSASKPDVPEFTSEHEPGTKAHYSDWKHWQFHHNFNEWTEETSEQRFTRYKKEFNLRNQ